MHKKIELPSKRNKVMRVVGYNNTYILKKFENHENYIREKEILNILKNANVNVPLIIKAEQSSLYLEDLGEETFLDWYEKSEKQNTLDISIIYKLSSWIKSFYEAVFDCCNEQIVLYDVNFKNFIIVEGKIYGIDFEEVQPGHIEEDAGRLTAFGLTYDPPMTGWKNNFRNMFIDILSEKLNIDKRRIIEEEKKELKAIEKRRGKQY